MPTKKKRKQPAVKPPTFEDDCGAFDFPCEAAKAEAVELYSKHGAKFVAWCRNVEGAIPISLLVKVARVECAGGTVKQKRNASFKDRG